MTIDHIFIFANDQGKVADKLVAFGLTEGSNRVHIGQGTANRKFYFNNFYLEILWVHNDAEIKNDQTKPTGLWQRAEFEINNFSPFGLCIVNSDDAETLFENAYSYQPDYFPKGMSIDIINNKYQPDLPWTFRLPFKGQMNHENEPTNHSTNISVMTKAIFEYNLSTENTFLNNFKNEDSIQFIHGSNNWLTLIFDNARQRRKQKFEQLRLTIDY